MTQRVAPKTDFLIAFSKSIAASFLLGAAIFAHSADLATSRQSTSKAYTLLEVYDLARASDPILAIARYRVDGAAAQKDVARGSILPQVSLFGDWSENRLRYESSGLSQIPSQAYSGERYGLQLRTPILNMRSFKEYQRQRALVDQSQQELAVAEATLLAGLVEAYLTVLLAEESTLQLESELSALDQQLEEASALYAKSLLPVTQVLETQTRVDQLRADIVSARGEVAIARERLTQLVGQRDLRLQPIERHLALMARVGDAEAAATMAIEFDPAIAAAEEAVNAARNSVSREKGSWWPEVDFVFNSQYSDVGFDNLASPPRTSEYYAISMSYSLFEGGAGAARLKGAWSEFYGAQQQLESARRQAVGRARAAWVNLQTAYERAQAARQAVATSTVSLEAARQSVQAGTARVTDVLFALAQNTRAQRDLSEARFQGAMGWLELELAMGSDPKALAPTFSQAIHRR